MDKKNIITKTESYVRKELEGKCSGHDWWHIHRVRNLALTIARGEDDSDLFIVEMTSLLHDIGDPKLYGGDGSIAPKMIGSWLDKMKLPEKEKTHILHIVAHMSFSKSLDCEKVEMSKEFKIVQDADRLDGIGAIGIARAFSYGGRKHRQFYDPNRKPKEHKTSKKYRANDGTTINHFYEKLLLLKDKMNTKTARKLAEGRHKFMESFLDEFYEEWDGKA